MRSSRTLRIRTGIFFVLALCGASSRASAQVTEFTIPSPSSGVHDIISGPDGNLWFTEFNTDKIGRITPAGVFTEFTIVTPNNETPGDITTGPDGRLWFTAFNGDAIGAITTAGAITMYAGFPRPKDIVTGPDGNLWYCQDTSSTGVAGFVKSLTTSGAPVASFSLGIGNDCGDIVVGPDGNLWFGKYILPSSYMGTVIRMTTAGVMTEFPLYPSSQAPRAMTLGLDGNLWFTEYVAGIVGKISTAGAITEYPGFPVNLTDIQAGPDGNLWVFEYANQNVYRMTVDGEVAEPIVLSDGPIEGTPGSDGNMWVILPYTNKIARIEVTCGDGVVNPWEGCDDGNLVFADGCNSFCEIEECYECTGEPSMCTPEDGVACDDGDICTTGDLCALGSCVGAPVGSCDDGDACTSGDFCTDGACAGTPIVSCVDGDGCCADGCGRIADNDCPICSSVPEPDASCFLAVPEGVRKSSLTMSDNADDAKDKLAWKWSKGEAVDLAEFVQPNTGMATYSVCLYDGGAGPQPLMKSVVPGGGTVAECDGKPCWEALGTKGFRYKDKAGTAGGITSLKLLSGTAGKSKIQVKGRGAPLGVPSLAPLADVVLQFLIDDAGSTACFKTTFPAAGVKIQNPEILKISGP